MAKRRRLDPTPGFAESGPPDLETKSMFPRYPPGEAPQRPAPIASVAADSAVQAAFEEVTAELSRARAEGRILLRLPLDKVDETWLMRDRLAADPEEMAALTASLRARGQQAPIEVADLGDGRYGLISGWRRLVALRRLAAEGGEPTVLALLRRPDAAAGAYLAMVEENEIRAGLSFYERARIVVRAADSGVFPDDRAALSHLFAAVPRARRSKIGSFTRLVRAFERPESPHQGLFFPTHLTEKQGLALAQAIDLDPGLADRIAAALAADPPVAAQVETARIAEFLRPARGAPALRPLPEGSERAEDGLTLRFQGREAVLRGATVADSAFRDALRGWLSENGFLREEQALPTE